MQLKEKINNLNKDLIFLKSELHKKDSEISKTNKIIQEYMKEGQNNNYNNHHQDNKLIEKSSNNQLIYNLKKQFKEIKKLLSDKNTELEGIKKTLKLTKLLELKVENQTLIDEIKNMNTKLENSLEKLKYFENLQSEYYIILENFKKQNSILSQLREENTNGSIQNKELSEKLNQQVSKNELLKDLE